VGAHSIPPHQAGTGKEKQARMKATKCTPIEGRRLMIEAGSEMSRLAYISHVSGEMGGGALVALGGLTVSE
jgi:uncharacterized membrane protein YphA (DoxX/SURF4 family)